MTFNEYQEEAHRFASYDKIETNGKDVTFIYPALGLAGETGETLEKVKKIIRDAKGEVSEEARQVIRKELGDVLWYWAELGRLFGFSAEELAQANLDKLKDRTERGVIKGNGDDR